MDVSDITHAVRLAGHVELAPLILFERVKELEVSASGLLGYWHACQYT